MTKENLERKIKKTSLVLSIIFGLLMLSGVTVKAQYRDNDNYRRERREERRERRQERREDRRDDGYYRSNNGYYGNGGYYGNNGYGYDVYQAAQQNGYQDGVLKGREERREGIVTIRTQSTSPYKSASNGYDRRYGSKDAYKQAYRQAFLQGFDQDYNEYNRNGNYNYGNRRRGY